jgi:hypothetical protein
MTAGPDFRFFGPGFPAIGFKKKILARLEGGIRVRRTGQYVVEASDR